MMTNTIRIQTFPILNYRTIHRLIPILVISGLVVSAHAEDFTYHRQYQDQMGTEAPDARNLTEANATAADGAVYANRNASEFSTVAYNWAPSTTPLRFRRGAVRPISAEDRAHLESTNTDGFIAVKNGLIIQEYYAKGMHPTTKHSIHSTGKSWTSAIWHKILLPVMSKTVGEVLPELVESIYGNQTIRAVVDMRVPVKWSEDYGDPQSPVVLSFPAVGLEYKNPTYETVAFVKGLQRNPKLKDGDWYYVSGNTNVMGLLGPKLADVHAYEGTRQFLEAIGMEYISGSAANLHGQYDAGGGQYMTLRDAVKLPYAMANGGKVADRQVLSLDYINDVFDAGEDKMTVWEKGPYGKALPGIKFYSNQWYVVDENIAVGIGSYGQYIAFNRATGVAIAKFSTYHTGQNFAQGVPDLAWIIEKVKTL
jgi:CubicO group peptidase (beta-lactamase class C family)